MSVLKVRGIRHDAAASDAINLDSSGNVGVGTASPASYANYKTLTIANENTTQGGVLRVQNSDATSIGLLYVDGGTSYNIKAVTGIPLVFGTNDTERMRIDASGRITMPSQPMMYANAYGGSGSSGSANPLILTSGLLNIGGHFNTSNGRFTAPIAGRYQVIFTALKHGSGGGDYYIRKNGSVVIVGYGTGDTATASTHIILELAESDYISFSTTGGYYTDYTSYSVQLIS